MIIECPYCETRFRLDEKALAGRRPALRCSRCKRTFPLPVAPPDDDLSFEYDDEPGWDEPEIPSASPTTGVDRQFSFPVTSSTEPTDEPATTEPAAADRDDRESTAADQPPLFADEDSGGVDRSDDAEDAWDEQLELGDDFGASDPEPDYLLDPEVPDEDDDVSAPVQTRAILVFLALVVGGYALFGWTLRSNPGWTTSVVRQVPLLGSELEAAELGKDIELRELRGRYERTKEGKLIFLITGKASNQHDQPVRGIRIHFRLHDANGNLVAEQSTTCGNAMRVDIVRDLTIQQVAILRGWGPQPPAETNVRPGEDCPLVSIFLDVPDTVVEYTGEVVQARDLT